MNLTTINRFLGFFGFIMVVRIGGLAPTRIWIERESTFVIRALRKGRS